MESDKTKISKLRKKVHSLQVMLHQERAKLKKCREGGRSEIRLKRDKELIEFYRKKEMEIMRVLKSSAHH